MAGQEGPTSDHASPIAVSLPEWLRLLPQFLRYGVAQRELMWAMSLGIQDREFAGWIVQRYIEANDSLPASFRSLLTWMLEERERLEAEASRSWPRYLVRFLSRAMIRYEAVNRALAT